MDIAIYLTMGVLATFFMMVWYLRRVAHRYLALKALSTHDPLRVEDVRKELEVAAHPPNIKLGWVAMCVVVWPIPLIVVVVVASYEAFENLGRALQRALQKTVQFIWKSLL